MEKDINKDINLVRAVFAKKEIQDDPDFETSFSSFLKEKNNINELISLYERFINSSADFDMLIRKIIWRAMCKSFGNAVKIGINVRFKHSETFEIGDNVFLGDFSYIQGRFDGTTKIGSNTWIGPQAYLDARNLIIGEYVGWGPGAKILGSSHTGIPLDIPIIQTDLLIKQTIIEDWADIGVNAVILPGINVGKGAIVGAGSVVTKDVESFSVVGGVPAKFIKWREGYEPGEQ